MRILGYILPIWLSISGSYHSVAQDLVLNVTHYGIEEGLSHRNVHFAHQDQNGLMWFGTDYGLNCFDGYNFKWYTKEKHGLQTNIISNALEDKDGLLWLFHGYDAKTYSNYQSTLREIDIFDPVSHQVQTFKSFSKGKTDLKSSEISGFTTTSQRELVFMTRAGELVFYFGKGSFSKVPLKKKYHDIRDFHWSSNGLFWFTARKESSANSPRYVIAVNEEGLEKYAFPLQNTHYLTFFYNDSNSPNENWISFRGTKLQDDGYQFWEVTQSGELIQDSLQSIYSNLGLDFSAFFMIAHYAADDDVAFFTSEDGTYIYDKQNQTLRSLREEYEYIGWANDVNFDNLGNIWVSTQFGIYLLKTQKNQFKIKLAGEDLIKPMRSLRIDENNRIWAVEEGNPFLHQIDLNTDQESSFFTNNNRIYALELSDNGDLYFPTGNYLVSKLNQENFQTQSFKPLVEPKYGSDAWAYFEDADGELWAGYDNGQIALFGKERSQWIPLGKDENEHFLTYQFIENGSLFWIVTDAGLFLFDKATKATKARYWAGGEGKFNLPFDNLRHAYLEQDSMTFWLGTGGNGLIRFNSENGEYQQFTKSDGLSNNVIYAVYPDDYDNLWLSSDYGIMRFNKNNHHVNSYLTKDGISHNEFNRVSHYQSEDGTLFFGSLNGITIFHPKNFQADSIASNIPLVINQVQQFVSDENQLADKTIDVLVHHTITLAPGDPFFRIEFSLLTYDDVDKVQYAYKIEGVDQNWNYQKENYIRLSRLPYGRHELRIKGQASNGQWSNNELAIRVVVLKPFYLKTWFLVLAFLLIFSAIFVYNRFRTLQLKRQKAVLEEEVKRRTKTIREQAEELKSLERLKSRFFANVSHELRTPLTLMLGPINSLLKRNRKNNTDKQLLEFVQRNGQQLMKLTNEILDLSKLEANRLEVEEVPVKFNDYIKDLTAQFFSFGTSDRVHFEVENLSDSGLILLIDKNKFEKIIHNFLSNALKFTPPGGEVKLTIFETENNIQMSVKDSGRGIHEEDLPHIFDRFYQAKKETRIVEGGTGIGLSLCKELAQLLGGKVWAESEFGKGSIFYFEFPKKVSSEVPSRKVLREPEYKSSAQKEILSIKENGNGEIASLGTIAPKEQTKILIVEDNNDLRQYLQFLLTDYQVTTAENGKKGLEQLQNSEDYNLIISDLMMPVMDGFEFLEKVKSKDKWRHIPVLMLTAKVNIKSKLRALRIGVDDYLNKPFEEEELKARIENLLRNYNERIAYASTERKSKQEESKAVSEKAVIGKADAEWLQEVEHIFSKNLSDSKFKMDLVAFKLNLSQRQMSRRLKQLTGLSPSHYLQEMRLQTAKDFLLTGKYSTVKETGYAVGFKDTQYFSERFQVRFGLTPSSYLR